MRAGEQIRGFDDCMHVARAAAAHRPAVRQRASDFAVALRSAAAYAERDPRVAVRFGEELETGLSPSAEEP
jgi:hypothetical protein